MICFVPLGPSRSLHTMTLDRGLWPHPAPCGSLLPEVLDLTGPAAQSPQLLPNSAPWRSLPYWPPKCALAHVDLSALNYRQCADRQASFTSLQWQALCTLCSLGPKYIDRTAKAVAGADVSKGRSSQQTKMTSKRTPTASPVPTINLIMEKKRPAGVAFAC